MHPIRSPNLHPPSVVLQSPSTDHGGENMQTCRPVPQPSSLHLSVPFFPLLTPSPTTSLTLAKPATPIISNSVSPPPANQIARPPCSPQEPAVTWRRGTVNKRNRQMRNRATRSTHTEERTGLTEKRRKHSNKKKILLSQR